MGSTESESTNTNSQLKPAPKKDILSEHLDLKHIAKSVISGQRFLAKFGKRHHKRRNSLDLMFADISKTVITEQKVLRKPNKPVSPPTRKQSEVVFANNTVVIKINPLSRSESVTTAAWADPEWL